MVKIRIQGRNCVFWDEKIIIRIFVPAKIKVMKSISRTFYKMRVQCIFFLVLPVFFFLFCLAYEPYDFEDFLAVGRDRYTLNLIVATLIVFGVLVLSRVLLFLLRNVLDLNWPLYILWCVGEVVFAGMMLSIPMGIGWSGQMTYFEVMSRCILYTGGVLVFPYSIITLSVQAYVLNRRSEAPAPDERGMIRFYDELHRLRLVSAAEAVLFIEAEENYVHVWHLQGTKARDYILRSSMRALDEELRKHGLVRCHRSFFVNPSHIVLVRKDLKAGYAFAELDHPGLRTIPVSKNYYEAVSKML